MDRSKIIFLFFIVIISFSNIFGQGIFVQADHPVYNFLERMEAAGIIDNFQNETRPLLRSKIVSHLSVIFNNRFKLGASERKFLEYFMDEFYVDMTGRLDKYEILLGDKPYDLLANKEKFLFIYYKPNEFTIFVKSHIIHNSILANNLKSAHIPELGGKFYGSVSNIFGYELDARNGFVFGEKSTALRIHELSYNFKLNEKPESKFFDKSFGYVTVEFPYLTFKIGRDRKLIGYGKNKVILSDYAPEFEAINFTINYKSFSFDYLHGWLQKVSSNSSNPLQKFIAHHRLSFAPSNKVRFGVGESVIYLRTAPQLDYLNPFNFYKSIEHQLRDQDNALLYFDLEILPVRNLRLFSKFLIDDIDFARIGKKWYGNKTAFNVGSNVYNIIPDFPLHLNLEYTRIEPYTFTHRDYDKSYTNSIYSLSGNQPPNSYRFDLGFNLTISPRIDIYSNFSYTKWGKNYYNSIGEYINVGGDILFGKRLNDPETISFLEGEIEQIYELQLSANYEFIRNVKISSFFGYSKTSSTKKSLILSIGLISFL